MKGRKSFAATGCSLLAIAVAGMGIGSASGAGPVAVPSAQVSAKPKPGRYQGKVGTFARIIMKTSRNRVKRLDAGVQASCQRASDGQIVRVELVAMKAFPKLKVKRNGKFKGEDQTKDGVRWEIKGRFVSRRKAKGSFEASIFRTIFNPNVIGGIDGELCAGSGKWTAKLKR